MVFVVGFGIREYTIAFQLVQDATRESGKEPVERWKPVRPVMRSRVARTSAGPARRQGDVARIFAVAICSALPLDSGAYESFLLQSGVLDEAAGLLSTAALKSPETIQTLRKEIQALVMAAEVQHIVDGMPA